MSEPKMSLRDFYFWVKGCVEHKAAHNDWRYYAHELAAEILRKTKEVDVDAPDDGVTETRKEAWTSKAWGGGVDDVTAAAESKDTVESLRLLSEGSGS